MRIDTASAPLNRVRAVQGSGRAPATDIPLNVIVIVLDDIGNEWFQMYGTGAKYTTDPNFAYCHTPFLDSVVAAGLRFDDFSAEPVCGPTRATINTGRYPFRHGLGFNIRDPNTTIGGSNTPAGYALPGTETFLAEHIATSRPDYALGAFGKWHMADGYTGIVANDAHGRPLTAPDQNLSHYLTLGYGVQRGNVYQVGGNYAWWQQIDGAIDPAPGFDYPPSDETNWNNSVVAAAAIDWIDDQGDTPFFAYVAFGAPHLPLYVPPFTMLSSATQTALTVAGLVAGNSLPESAGYATTNFPLMWRAAMEATDTACQRVWDSLTPSQQGRTMLIICGDNGTVANALPPGFSHTKRSVFWGGTRAPLVMRGPLVKGGSRSTVAMAHAADIMPTVLACMGIPKPAGVTLDGVSLMPLMQDTVDRTDPQAVRVGLLVETFQPGGQTNHSLWITGSRTYGWWEGRYRLVSNTAGVLQLYDNMTDPLEATDLLGVAVVSAVNQAIADAMYARKQAVVAY